MKTTPLGRHLRNAGISQVDLAGKLKVSEAHMSMLVKGRRNPSPRLAAKIEKLTGISFRDLFQQELAK